MAEFGWERLLFLIVATGAVVATTRGWRRPTGVRAGVCLVVMAPVVWGTIAWTPALPRLPERLAPHETRDQGYVSSDSCRACHPAEYASWHASYHRTMTQIATPEAIAAPHEDVSLRGAGRRFEVRFEDGQMWIDDVDPWKAYWQVRRSGRELPPDFSRVRAPVVMTTGSHHMQLYWMPEKHGGLRHASWAWLIRDQRWVPGETVYLQPPPGTSGLAGAWELNCIKCHSTGGQPRLDVGAQSPDPRVGELGIACEACHGPAHAHVDANRNVLQRYWKYWTGGRDATIVNPKRLSAKRASQICANCHSGRLHQDYDRNTGAVFRPGDRLEDHFELRRFEKLDPAMRPDYFWNDGTSRVTGREYTAMVESACFKRGELGCLSCHSMHRSEPNDQLAPDRMGDRACLQCHDAYAADIEAHTHHPATSSGSRCMNCHMPNTTYGLLMLTRSHRIDSPSAAASARTGRPNACNLCHLDQTLEWTDRTLARWYGSAPATFERDERQEPAAALWLLSGDAVQRATAAWHFGWEPARAISGTRWPPELLARSLDDPYASVRYLAAASLRKYEGLADIDYDFALPAAQQRPAIERILARVQSVQGSPLSVVAASSEARLRARRNDVVRRIRE